MDTVFMLQNLQDTLRITYFSFLLYYNNKIWDVMRFLKEKFYQQDIPTLAVYGSFLNKFHIVLGVHHIKNTVSVSLTALRSVEDAPPRQKVFDKPCRRGFPYL